MQWEEGRQLEAELVAAERRVNFASAILLLLVATGGIILLFSIIELICDAAL